VSPKRPVVLVVEDEFLVRAVAVGLVEDAGYEAVEATNADQAIAILETRDDIRIVFTDVNMPGSMDGLRLAAAVRDRWPPIEFIVASGRQPIDVDDLPERSLFLMKPYSHFQVAQALRALTPGGPR
jgi:CheY-like chemotaxis protein